MIRRIVLGFGALALAVSAVFAAEPVRVYTNADLERMFGPAPEKTPPTPVMDAADWDEVLHFLDRQYDQLEAQRSFELDRAVVEQRERREREDAAADRGAYYGSIYYAGSWPHAVPRTRSGIGRNIHRRPSPPGPDAGDGRESRPVPLHARRDIVPLHARRPLN